MVTEDKRIFDKAEEKFVSIYELKFLHDNPRIYAVTHGSPGFSKLTPDQQQDFIYEKLQEEKSVKNLIPEIERLGQLLEPIVVRWDTKEVVEGNSRLAVYRQLNETEPDGGWDRIHCKVVSSFTEEEQTIFLNSVHVKGKTPWTAYARANFAYVLKSRGWSVDGIAKACGESSATIRKRINMIGLMKKNHDTRLSNFRYYKVLVNSPRIRDGLADEEWLDGKTGWDKLLSEIKDDETHFDSNDLRDKMPVILEKPKVLKKYISGKLTFEQAYDQAKVSGAEASVKQATTLLLNISGDDVKHLERNRLNAFKQLVRKLGKASKRLQELSDKFAQ